ncbi:MAG: hypothetical protein IJB79_04145 [Candidatus Gastranaerophilales bacterium]|nr:hypothetical protein [Candidatus Gastranaerophilales bacterium]
MKIGSIDTINIYKALRASKRKTTQSPTSTNESSLAIYCPQNTQIALNTQKEDDYFKFFINKKGKVTKKEYDEVIKKHPRTLVLSKKLCEDIQKRTNSSPETIGKIAHELKKFYDKEYGKYTIISVGTSPAPVTEVMQNLGSKVIFLPITGLRELEQNHLYFNRVNYPTLASKHENLQAIMDYCTKKGITKKDTEAIIILDLCASGKSARIIKQLLVERKDLDEDKIFVHDLTKTLEFIKDNSDSDLTPYEIDWLDADMRMSRCAKLCNVAHFYYDNSGKNSSKCIVRKPNETNLSLFNRFQSFSQPNARAWALCSTHEAMKLEESTN